MQSIKFAIFLSNLDKTYCKFVSSTQNAYKSTDIETLISVQCVVIFSTNFIPSKHSYLGGIWPSKIYYYFVLNARSLPFYMTDDNVRYFLLQMCYLSEYI